MDENIDNLMVLNFKQLNGKKATVNRALDGSMYPG
jgi:hypothetical protein